MPLHRERRKQYWSLIGDGVDRHEYSGMPVDELRGRLRNPLLRVGVRQELNRRAGIVWSTGPRVGEQLAVP